MTTKVRSIFFAFALLLVLLMTVPVLARDAQGTKRAKEVELTGTIQAITLTTVTIDGQLIEIDHAEIHDTISVGDRVKVHFQMAADGTLIARELELALTSPQAVAVGHDVNDDHGVDALDDNGQNVIIPGGHDANDDHGADVVDNSGRNTATLTQGDDHGHGDENQHEDGDHHGEGHG